MNSNVGVANDIFHLSLKVKRFHWAVRGPDAPYLHKQLDDLFTDLVDYYDRLFEDAFINNDEIQFDVALFAGDEEYSTSQVVEQVTTNLNTIIHSTERAGVDQGRRGTGNILDDIAEGLTNWVYLLSLYNEPN